MAIKTIYIKDTVQDKEFTKEFDTLGFNGQLSVTFYSDEYQTPIEPTAGSLEFKITDDQFEYGTVEDGSISYPTDAYNRPTFFAACNGFKVTLSGITGATHFIARCSFEL